MTRWALAEVSSLSTSQNGATARISAVRAGAGRSPILSGALVRAALLRVPLQSSGRPMMLEAELGPCQAPPEITCQLVHVRVNGTAVGGARLQALSLLRCEIEPTLARPGGILEIEFECPGFYVPAGLDDSADQRPLSCWFTFVRVYTTDMFSPGPHFAPSEPDIPEIAASRPFREVTSRAAPQSLHLWHGGQRIAHRPRGSGWWRE